MTPMSLARRLAAVAAVALPATLGVQAQTVLTPGHPDLTAAPPQSYEYDVRFARETPQVIGSATSTETLVGDRLTIATQLKVAIAGQETADTTVVSWPSLAPVLRVDRASAESSVRLTFGGGRIGGRAVLGNLNEAIDAALPAGAFSEGLKERIARSVPFRAGYAATFQVVDRDGFVETDTVRVVGADGDAWTVEIVTPGSPTNTYTVDAATRTLRRMAFSPQANLTIEVAAPLVRADGPILRPGDAALNTAWLGDDTSTYVIRVVEPMQMDAGTMTTTRTVAGGVVTSETVTEVPMQNMRITATATADALTLAPRSYTTAGAPTDAAITYSAGAVAGTTTPKNGTPAPVAATLAQPVFGNAWTTEIAQSLPFEAGYMATVETYDAEKGVQTTTYTVVSPADAAGVPGWTVTAETPAGPFTYVIDATTREVVSVRMSPQPGVTVEMVRQP